MPSVNTHNVMLTRLPITSRAILSYKINIKWLPITSRAFYPTNKTSNDYQSRVEPFYPTNKTSNDYQSRVEPFYPTNKTSNDKLLQHCTNNCYTTLTNQLLTIATKLLQQLRQLSTVITNYYDSNKCCNFTTVKLSSSKYWKLQL